MNFLDNFLDHITMYRLVLYYLICLLVAAGILALMQVLPFSASALAFSSLFILAVCLGSNWLFAKVWNVVVNVESAYITALILALIITPDLSGPGLLFTFWVAVWAMAAKYLFTWRGKHIFNPAAIAVAITAVAIHQSATWWVGSASLLPVVLIGGVLVVRKIRRADLVLSFLIAAIISTVGISALQGGDMVNTAMRLLQDTPYFFFAFIMLTEPLTTPPTHNQQIWYGALIGLLFAPQLHVASLYSTPELALLTGNIFSFLVSPKLRPVLQLLERREIGSEIYELVFKSNQKINFRPGQYLEWTLAVPHPDGRGNRRFFTIASSPTEGEVKIGVKLYPRPSRFKQSLLSLQPGARLIASQLAGSFTLPENPAQKIVFIAGGIGITPYRSMIKYLLDSGEKRDIIVLYSSKQFSELVYTDVFAAAEQQLGIKMVYVLSDANAVPTGWQGRVGMIDATLIQKEVPDFSERIFYISGPQAMVVVEKNILHGLGIASKNITTDYFPGFA